MAFTGLLWTCLCDGKRLEENQIGISLDNREGEISLFFQIDCDPVRRCFNHTSELCDGLVFYRLTGNSPHLVFAEFKSCDIKKAVSQIERSIELVCRNFPSGIPAPRITALILSKHGVPQSAKGVQIKRKGVGIVVKSAVTSVRSLREYVTL